MTSGNVYGRLREVLGLRYNSGKYVKYSGSQPEYTVSRLSISVANAPLAPSDPNSISQLTVTGYITVEVPLSFGWGHLPSMKITMKFKSLYVPKF